jgi:citronellol/citronellal dehydrogenase
MKNSLTGKTLFITGASRGIGRAIALRCAKEGANLVLAAKTKEPHPTLPGTIHTVAEEVEELGGRALPIQLDVRDEVSIHQAMVLAVEHFGGIDLLVNNASAINLTPTVETSAKRFDLMFAVNVRATFLCSQAAIPYLIKAPNPHILNLAPPINLDPKWFKNHLAYTMSKYGMSMCTLGMAEEFKGQGIAVNALWPKTTIATKAIEVNFPKEIFNASRKPDIVAEAAYIIFTKDSKKVTGHFFIDEAVLRSEGMNNFEAYALNPSAALFTDLFLDDGSV